MTKSIIMNKKEKEQKVTSTEIKIALSQFRPKDYFLTEVKNGSTYFPPPQGLLMFDGVGIRRSYTQPCITIYEVKVSRGDFLQDNKWKLYFQYCNEFYFVVPKGLIDKSELPDNVGLIYYNPETKKLLTKQKSKYWKCENPWEMYQYIIYSRLDEERTPFCKDRTEYARNYLEGKMTNHSIGDALRSKFAQEIQRLEREAERIECYRMNEEKYQKICDTLSKHGISTARCRTADEIVEDLENALSSGINMRFVGHCRRELEYMLQEFEKMEKKEDGEHKTGERE